MIGRVESAAGWKRSDLQPEDWLVELTDEQSEEARRALAHARQLGLSFDDLTREDFPLPTVGPLLARTRDALEHGVGFQLIRNFPTDGLDKDDLRLLFWGLGKHIGTAVSQSSRGDLIGDVRDMHLADNPGTARAYTSNRSQSFHTDSSDVSALFVLRQGAEGGDSHLVSAIAVHNAILERRPDLLEVLYQPFYWSWQGQEAPGERPYYQQPVFSSEGGAFACRLIAAHIYSAQMFPEVPRLTPKQIEALELVQDLCRSDEFEVVFKMRPGDLEIMNSHVTFHGRSSFRDGDSEDKIRHLLRMWLSVPNSRALSPSMSAVYRDRSPGAVRGGFPSRSGRHLYETRVTTD